MTPPSYKKNTLTGASNTEGVYISVVRSNHLPNPKLPEADINARGDGTGEGLAIISEIMHISLPPHVRDEQVFSRIH